MKYFTVRMTANPIRPPAIPRKLVDGLFRVSEMSLQLLQLLKDQRSSIRLPETLPTPIQ